VLFLLIIGAIVASLIINTYLLTNLITLLRGPQPIQVRELVNIGWVAIESILVIVLGVGVARTVMKQTIKGLGENRIDINIRTLIGRILFILIILVVIFWLLSIWQIGVSLPLAILGGSAAVFALSIQDILKDLVAGFYILLERPFHIGDIITVASAGVPIRTGKVEDIQLRITRMRITSGEEVAVPNSLVFGGIVVNNTRFTERRATVTMTFALEAFDKDKTPESVIAAIKECEKAMPKPEPLALVSSFASEHVTLKVHFWVESGQVAGVSDVMYALHAAFPDVDITLVESLVDG
jgi:small-conductance mechanosensitive channel